MHDGLAAEAPKQAGFDSYADYADEGSGSGVSTVFVPETKSYRELGGVMGGW